MHLIAIALVVLASSMLAANSPRPNIVIILADDLGLGSVGCYGAPSSLIKTPHIDRLAREGVRFTDAYTPSSVCTPTRYGLLTGRYCWRSWPKSILVAPLGPLIIEPTRPTVASLLKGIGYKTALIGKWHLGFGTKMRDDDDLSSPLSPGPRALGFDYYFGIPQNHGEPWGVFAENEAVWGLRSTNRIQQPRPSYYGANYIGFDAPQRDDWTAQTILTDRAVDWIKQQTSEKPFFLYFAAAAVHEPVTPGKEARGTSGAGLYGDWIHDMDLTVGRIMEALESSGLGNNTLVIFTSDNGAVHVEGAGENWRTGIRKSSPPYTSLLEAVLDAQGKGLKPNGMLRGQKGGIHDGGFRVPFIARWPASIPAGTEAGMRISLVDIMATTADLLDIPVFKTKRTLDDSVSFLPALLGKPNARAGRESVVLHSGRSGFAILQGKWKWIEGQQSTPQGKVTPHPSGELYDLSTDPAEAINLRETHPEVAQKLNAELNHVRTGGSSIH